VGHPKIDNKTPFAFESLFVTDEDARSLFVPIVKATFIVGEHDEVRIAEKQHALNPAGTYNGAEGASSYRYEPETAFFKTTTDVVLVGHAWAGSRPVTEIEVSLKVGPVSKRARVVGDRYWMKSLGMLMMTSPEPFDSLPLIYERAFGGHDKDGRFDPRNPVGRGFRGGQVFDGAALLPNIEDPQNPIRSIDDRPTPVGFGFVSPDWQPRANLGGTYDEQWMNERMPLLPKDFDRRFFNAASPGLIASGYLKGNETVLIENASPRGTISFDLPRVNSPKCRVQLTGRRDALVETNLDTVIVDTDEDLLILMWRGNLPVRNGPHDIVSVEIQAEGISAIAAAR
jgi:hypothetical protein